MKSPHPPTPNSIPSSVRAAMVMAAGLGTRLSPFTRFQTKALLPVMGVPIAQYTIDSLVDAGVGQVVANIHHQGSRAAEGMAALDYGASRLVISDESQQLLGSAGGIRKALSHFGNQPFFLANADVLCDVDWNELAACHQRLRSAFGVVLTLTVFSAGPPGAQYREIHFDSNTGLLTSLGELVEGRPYFVGAAILEPEALAQVPEGVPSDFVEAILRPAISGGRAGVFVSQGAWFDIGEPKLWVKTHLALMELLEMMEQGRSAGSSSQAWKERVSKRILRKSFRVSERVWASRESQNSGPADLLEWKAPCYWGGVPRQGGQNPLRVFGPEGILYGPYVDGNNYTRGIGFGGEWVGL